MATHEVTADELATVMKEGYRRQLAGEDTLYERAIPGASRIQLEALGFGQILLRFVTLGGMLSRAWAYDDAGLAWRAALVWDGKGDGPPGWWRCYATGRRRPGGDPAKEYLQP
jgi:hypothetical protein